MSLFKSAGTKLSKPTDFVLSANDVNISNTVSALHKDIAKRKESDKASEEAKDFLGVKDHKAKYKIEINYIDSRKTNAPSACGVMVWESGKKLNGDGDASMFWCVNTANHGEGCGGLIPFDNSKNGVALCPNCNKLVNEALLPMERIGVFSIPNLAKEVERIFFQLGSSCDIYLKFSSKDREALLRMRRNGLSINHKAIYTMNRILQDSLGGTPVVKCIENFLRA